MPTVIIVIAALISLIIIWVVCGQNKLVHGEDVCGNALSQIGVQQASRWDTLNALADLTKGYSVQNFEEKVRMSRMVYNGTVTKYNRLARALPGSLVAKSLKFGVRNYLQEYPGKADMPNMVR